jgi:hypothetical protein
MLAAYILTACRPAVPVGLPTLEPNIAARFYQDTRQVSMNHLALADPMAQSYRFLFVGHIYGSHGSKATHPSATLMQSLASIKSMGLSMIASGGDMVPHSSKRNYDTLDTAFLNQVGVPVFNAPGNHDLEDAKMYASRYGPTYYTFRYGPSQMIFLDAETVACYIVGEQRGMLDAAMRAAANDPAIKQIFIFVSKLIFMDVPVIAESNSDLAKPNEWTCYKDNNYAELLKETLLPAAKVKPVYVFAGDAGAWGGNLSPYYDKRPDANLYTLASGIGDTPQDVVLQVLVNGSDVAIKVISLTGRPVKDITAYNMSYWEGIARQSAAAP